MGLPAGMDGFRKSRPHQDSENILYLYFEIIFSSFFPKYVFFYSETKKNAFIQIFASAAMKNEKSNFFENTIFFRTAI